MNFLMLTFSGIRFRPFRRMPADENREPAHFQRLLRRVPVPASFLFQNVRLPVRIFAPLAPVAPRSCAPCFRTTAAPTTLPPRAFATTHSRMAQGYCFSITLARPGLRRLAERTRHIASSIWR